MSSWSGLFRSGNGSQAILLGPGNDPKLGALCACQQSTCIRPPKALSEPFSRCRSAMTPLQDAFISYGRADSKAFAQYLHDRLGAMGYKVWFDFDDIPAGVDFQQQINDGINKSDNFLFLISPWSVNSPHCAVEIEQALKQHKRMIPLLHVESISRETWHARNPGGTEAQWQCYQADGKHSCFPNMHPAIKKINWIYFRESVDDFDASLDALCHLLQRHQVYVRQHTMLLNQALTWEQQQRQTQHLLIGEARQQAEAWLTQQFSDSQPPCRPTDLHCDFIAESTKNANNLMTQVFIAHAEPDGAIAEKVRRSLMRAGITTWTYYSDVELGSNFQAAIARGVEEADNVLLLLSPQSLQSPYCQQEIDLTLALNKRLIVITASTVSEEQVPAAIRTLQRIDLTDNVCDRDYQEDESNLLRILLQDADYYHEHKVLLTKALKWQRQQRNPCILLRGYELQSAQAWLQVATNRTDHDPTPLQADFITESARQPSGMALDVFVSYSRADSGLARKLNDALQRHGKRTWFDQESIASGNDFRQEIYRGIETSNHFLFILSPSAIQSPYCADEVDYAVKLNKRIVPVLYRPIAVDQLHPALAKVQWLDFRHGHGDFASNFKDLIRTLDTDPEHLHAHTQLLMQAIAWEKRGQRSDRLLRGQDLAEAEQWLLKSTGKQPTPTALHGRYVAASRKAINAAQNAASRRQRILVGVLGTLLLLTIAGGSTAFAQFRLARQRRQEAEATQAKAEIIAQTLTTNNLLLDDLNIEALINGLKTIHSVQEQWSTLQPDARFRMLAALHQVVYAIKEKNRLTDHVGSIWDVDFSPAPSPQQQIFASAGKDGTVRLWQANGTPIKTLRGHTDSVWDVKFSPDGNRLASASKDGTVQLWQRDGTPLKTLEGHARDVWEVRFSPDGQMLASAGSDQTIRLWQQDGTLLQTLIGHTDIVWHINFSPDGETLASASQDGTVRLWQRDGTPLALLIGHTDYVGRVSFSPDQAPEQQILASSSGDKTVRLWTRTGIPLAVLAGHTDAVTDIAFSADGNVLASASADQTVRLWSREGIPLKTLAGHTDKVWDIRFSPNGNILASASYDSTVRLWDVASGTLIATLSGHRDRIWDVHFSADSKTLASASIDGTIRLWQTTGIPSKVLTGHDLGISDIRVSPDGTLLASASDYVVGGRRDKIVRLWQRDGRLVAELEGHTSSVTDIRFSPDSQVLAAAGRDRTIRLWQRDGTPMTTLVGHLEPVTNLRFSPDGQVLASASNDGTVRLWQQDGTRLAKLSIDANDDVGLIRFSPNGQVLAAAGEAGTIQLWQRDGTNIGTINAHKKEIRDLRFSPDGTLLASASTDSTVKLWQLNGTLIQTLVGHDPQSSVDKVRFSADGTLLASASDDDTVRLWQLDDGSSVSLQGHTDDVVDMHFIFKGQIIASGSKDNTIRFWQLNGTPIVKLKDHRSAIEDLRLFPDRQTLASASADRTIRLWNFELEALMAKGCDWLQDYMENPSTPAEEKALCADELRAASGSQVRVFHQFRVFHQLSQMLNQLSQVSKAIALKVKPSDRN